MGQKPSSILPFLLCLLLTSCTSTPTDDFSILFVGDTHLGENYQEDLDENILVTEGYDYSFKNFDSILGNMDLVIANLETPLTTQTQSTLEGQKDYLHWSDPKRAVETFLKHHVDVFSLANNHTLDFGIAGLEETTSALTGAGIQYFGAGENLATSEAPFIQDNLVIFGAFELRDNYVKDYRFYAQTENAGVNPLDILRLSEQIAELKKENPKAFIIIFPHWGDNYEQETEEQIQVAHTLIDAGADLILGHGAHLAQGIEQYKDHWIIYNLGNFVFNAPGRYQKLNKDPTSLMARLIFEGEQRTLRLYPIFTDNLVTNYKSRFLTEEEFEDYKQPIKATKLKEGKDEYGSYFETPLF